MSIIEGPLLGSRNINLTIYNRASEFIEYFYRLVLENLNPKNLSISLSNNAGSSWIFEIVTDSSRQSLFISKNPTLNNYIYRCTKIAELLANTILCEFHQYFSSAQDMLAKCISQFSFNQSSIVTITRGVPERAKARYYGIPDITLDEFSNLLAYCNETLTNVFELPKNENIDFLPEKLRLLLKRIIKENFDDNAHEYMHATSTLLYNSTAINKITPYVDTTQANLFSDINEQSSANTTYFQNLANLTSDAINFTIQATTGLLNDMIKNGTSSISTSVQSAYATESIISTTMRATNSIGRTIAQNFSHSNNSQREGIYYVLGDENTKESCKYCLDFNSEKLEFAAMIVIASLAALFFIGLLCWSYKSKKHDYRKDNPENGAPTKLTRLDLENQSAALLK